jgi:hypothetical protein
VSFEKCGKSYNQPWQTNNLQSWFQPRPLIIVLLGKINLKLTLIITSLNILINKKINKKSIINKSSIIITTKVNHENNK